MLYLKTNEDNEVIFFHKQPFHEKYGLGKTEEELKAEGYLIDYLKDLPRAEDREGFVSKTFCDGEKFWFTYAESTETPEERYIREMNLLNEKHQQEKERTDAEIQKRELLENVVEGTKQEVRSITFRTNTIDEMVQMNLTDSAMLIMEMIDKEEKLENQQKEVNLQKQDLVAVNETLKTEKEKIKLAQNDLITATSDAAMMTMQVMDMDFQLMLSKEELLQTQEALTTAQQELIEAKKQIQNMIQTNAITGSDLIRANAQIASLIELNAKNTGDLLQAKEEMVTTNIELALAKEQLRTAQQDISNMILFMLEGGNA